MAISRYIFRHGISLGLDAIAEGSVNHLDYLDGVVNSKHAVPVATVSGLESRWIAAANAAFAGCRRCPMRGPFTEKKSRALISAQNI